MMSTLDKVLAAIRGHRFSYANEDELQQGLAAAIAKEGLDVQREVRFDGRNRLRGLDLVFYTGRESKAQKETAKEAFTSGDADVFVMSLRAGAGLNGLQDVSHVCVFGELDWSPAMHDQCIGRLHRDGQDESTIAYFLVSDVGSDPVMEQVLQLKRMQAEPLMGDEAELFAPTADSGDRIRDLAKDFLSKRDLAAAA